MSETKDAWDRVANVFSQLGRDVGERFRAMTAEEQEDVSGAVDKLVERVDRAFTSLGDTLRDPASRDSVKQAASSLGDAIATTFEDVGQRIRRTLRSPDER
jgi:hypothetical protein